MKVIVVPQRLVNVRNSMTARASERVNAQTVGALSLWWLLAAKLAVRIGRDANLAGPLLTSNK